MCVQSITGRALIPGRRISSQGAVRVESVPTVTWSKLFNDG